MNRTATAIAAALFALSSMAQADTIKQIWNQEIGPDNPGQVISAGECLQDDFSRFGCWHEGDEVDAPAPAAGAIEEPTEEPNGNGNGDGPIEPPPTTVN